MARDKRRAKGKDGRLRESVGGRHGCTRKQRSPERTLI